MIPSFSMLSICVAAILPNVGVSLCDSELLFNGQQPQKAHLEALPEARVWFRPIHHLRIVLLRHPLDIPVCVEPQPVGLRGQDLEQPLHRRGG